VKSATKLFEEIPNVKIDKEALELAVELMERKAGKFEPEKLKDDYAEAVWELINAKIEHRAPEIVTAAPSGAKVINIMDALKKSVQAQGKGKSAPAPKRGASRGAKKSSKSAPKRKSA
jgi:DNA end-binding protein Ku